MKTVLLLSILLANCYQDKCLNCTPSFTKSSLNATCKHALEINDESVRIPDFIMAVYKGFEAVLVVTDFGKVNLNSLKSTTVVLPLESRFLTDENFIKVLSTAEKALLTLQDENLLLNNTEKFLQQFWRRHKTTKIFIAARSMIYAFNPFTYDYDEKEFGKLQIDIEYSKRSNAESFPLRVELFSSVYIEPLNWKNVSTGFRGPDVSVLNIIMNEMNLSGELKYKVNFVLLSYKFILQPITSKTTEMRSAICWKTDRSTEPLATWPRSKPT